MTTYEKGDVILVLRKLGKLSHRDLTAINNFLNELLELKKE